MDRWNVEESGLLEASSPPLQWHLLPRTKLAKSRDEDLKVVGSRILDAFIGMSDQERSDAFGHMIQDVHMAPSYHNARMYPPAHHPIHAAASDPQKMHACDAS